ncbi:MULTISPECIES: helix-turn-helix domain-containing protein [Thermus]|uniref:helix-turn-helix domain-containing protein n=1 Tax=Thermus TaxID=270 RepID=UPI001F2987DB|nr:MULTISPECIES: helix-turn-helix transcriptional regulator [Thermus]
MIRYRVRIKELADANGITLYRIARTSGLLTNTVYNAAEGRHQPTLETLAKIHGALEVLLGRRVELDELIEVIRE